MIRLVPAAGSGESESRDRPAGVPPLDPTDPPLLAVEERGGRVNNLYRCLGNQPRLLESWTDFAWTLRAECATPRTLRELLILRAAQLTASRYLWEDHVRFGRDAGLGDEQVGELSRWRSSARFDERERAALEFAERLVLEGRVSDEVLVALERHFAAHQVVELTLTVGFYTMVPRVIDALRVPLQDDLLGADAPPGAPEADAPHDAPPGAPEADAPHDAPEVDGQPPGAPDLDERTPRAGG
jgi:4-carboxymuconolactone decarboxylase